MSTVIKPCVSFAVAALLAAGCVESMSEQEEVSQELSGDFVDSSGTVFVRIKECPWSAVSQRPTAACSVDADYVLVGGGAEIEGEAHPGALLWASYPDAFFSTWTAASKDHGNAYAHRLRARSIGLRLAGVSPATLRQNMYMAVMPSSTANHPATVAALPPGYLLVGGGARTSWSGAGQLLIASHPDAFQWVAESKDHTYASPGTVTAYAIGVAASIPGFGSLESIHTAVSSSETATGYGTATALAPTGWVLSSVGARANYSGAGRLLTDMFPEIPSVSSPPHARVYSKDHQWSSSGATTAYALSLRRRP